jgi:hypothetical protein
MGREQRATARQSARRKLRRRLQQVKTLAQFEAMLLDAPEEHRAALRRVMAPLLPDGLPCCGPARLREQLGDELYERTVGQPFAHVAACPTNAPRILLVQ